MYGKRSSLIFVAVAFTNCHIPIGLAAASHLRVFALSGIIRGLRLLHRRGQEAIGTPGAHDECWVVGTP